MHFEKVVFSDKFTVDLIKSVVKLHELLPLVVLVRENIFSQVHLHEVKQFEKQFTDPQIFANHLSFGQRENYIKLKVLC